MISALRSETSQDTETKGRKEGEEGVEASELSHALPLIVSSFYLHPELTGRQALPLGRGTGLLDVPEDEAVALLCEMSMGVGGSRRGGGEDGLPPAWKRHATRVRLLKEALDSRLKKGNR